METLEAATSRFSVKRWELSLAANMIVGVKLFFRELVLECSAFLVFG